MLEFTRDTIKKANFAFRKSSLYSHLKKVRVLRSIRERYGRLVGNWMLYKFRLHGDFMHLSALKRIVREHGITSIVETGTYLGYTTILLAETFPDLQIYTSEINHEFYLKARKNTQSFKNINLYNTTSPEFIESLISNNLIGSRPFFYLDAHWLDDWPLEKELQIISKKIKSAVISIDDFKVHNDSRFIFDKYGNKECSLDLVIPNLSKKNNYNLLFPNYGKEVLFKGKIIHPNLIGYIIIFQNMKEEFKSILKSGFISKFFKNESSLIKMD